MSCGWRKLRLVVTRPRCDIKQLLEAKKLAKQGKKAEKQGRKGEKGHVLRARQQKLRAVQKQRGTTRRKAQAKRGGEDSGGLTYRADNRCKRERKVRSGSGAGRIGR